jgi:hypothetical protein
MNCGSKIVVFDLDETLGYFVEFGMFWDTLKHYYKNNEDNTNISSNINKNINKNKNPVFDQSLFNKLLDLYPEFTRPNILNILKYLKKQKQDKKCHKLMIYTNNQGPPEWAQQIKGYFEEKLNFELFDQIIGAFKVNGKQVELCRTTHMKTHKDFISCTKIPETTQICFIDDVFHPGMTNDNIYYIHIKPYTYDLTFDTIVDRFIGSGLLLKNVLTSMKDSIITGMKRYNYTYVEKQPLEHEIDAMLTKTILYHLHTFFNRQIINTNTNANSNKTVKNRKPINPNRKPIIKTIKNKRL